MDYETQIRQALARGFGFIPAEEGIDISKLKIGDRVHYIPYKGCAKDQYENGMVKEIPEHTKTVVRVVYHCAGEWDNFMNYTSALTNLSDLGLGWMY